MNALDELIATEKDAREFGFDWPNEEMILDQIYDECREIQEELNLNDHPEKLQEEIGDVIHAAISLCIFCGFDVKETLAKTNTKFAARMHALKALTRQENLENLQGQTIEYMLKLWREAKKSSSE
jgi:uncharacterized protein YabN with tetrapyrrole methylase and pyrophosphatase domain